MRCSLIRRREVYTRRDENGYGGAVTDRCDDRARGRQDRSARLPDAEKGETGGREAGGTGETGTRGARGRGEAGRGAERVPVPEQTRTCRQSSACRGCCAGTGTRHGQTGGRPEAGSSVHATRADSCIGEEENAAPLPPAPKKLSPPLSTLGMTGHCVPTDARATLSSQLSFFASSVQTEELHNAVPMQHRTELLPRIRLAVVGTIVLLCFTFPLFAAIDAYQLGAQLRRRQLEHHLPRLLLARHAHRGLDLQDPVRRAGSGALRADQGPATNVWSKTASVATLKNTYGITGTVYYGYRAWGPNWPYNAAWTKGSGHRLRHRHRRQRQPLQPEQAAARPVRASRSARTRRPRPAPTAPSTPAAPPTATRTAAPAPQGPRARADHHLHRHQAHARAEGRRRLRSARARPDQERHRDAGRLPRHLRRRRR